MLQQTQVKTVIPYYERWVKAFPTLAVLARSPLSRVLKLWEGLGYYSRARNLHRASKIILKKWGGKLPASRAELQTLPGIGRYTAGAIASIAFNQPEPILDGNVKRVLARIFALKESVDQTKGGKKLWETAEALVEASHRPGDFNQSLMELGALVCLPENPRCETCPVESRCEAHRLNRETDFPVKARAVKIEDLKTVAAVIWKKGRVLVERQPLNAQWGGLWMFPQWIYTNGKEEKLFLKEKMRSHFGLRIENFKPKTEIEHSFTKYRVQLKVYEGRCYRAVIARSPAAFRRGDEAISKQRLLRPHLERRLAMTRWTSPKKLSTLPLPSPHQKIAEAIRNHA